MKRSCIVCGSHKTVFARTCIRHQELVRTDGNSVWIVGRPNRKFKLDPKQRELLNLVYREEDRLKFNPTRLERILRFFRKII